MVVDPTKEILESWAAAGKPEWMQFHPDLYETMVGCGVDDEKIYFVHEEGKGVACIYDKHGDSVEVYDGQDLESGRAQDS